MCKLKSAIVLKDRIFMPDYDSHSKMLEELGIKDDYLGASKKFVRVELSPEDGNVFSDIDGWKLTVDQDIKPDWFSEEDCKPKVIESVKEWAKSHIHIGVDGLQINAGENHYIKDCKDVVIRGSATVENICGSATVEDICGSATVKYIYDSATVKYIYGSATVKDICGSATVENIYGSATVKDICGSATVKDIYGSATVENIYGSATVEDICGSATVKYIYGSATVISSVGLDWKNKESVILADNATFKDNYGRTIYQAGSFKLIAVENNTKIVKE